MIGNGMNIKSMAYVDNVAAFVDFCMDKSSGIHIYNYIDKPDLNMNDLVKLVRSTIFNKDNITSGADISFVFKILILLKFIKQNCTVFQMKVSGHLCTG